MKLDLTKEIFEFIGSHCETLKVLRIIKFNMNSEAALSLLNTKLKNLQILNVAVCDAPVEAAKSFKEIIKNNSEQLKELSLERNKFSSSIMHILLILPECKELKSLSI